MSPGRRPTQRTMPCSNWFGRVDGQQVAAAGIASDAEGSPVLVGMRKSLSTDVCATQLGPVTAGAVLKCIKCFQSSTAPKAGTGWPQHCMPLS